MGRFAGEQVFGGGVGGKGDAGGSHLEGGEVLVVLIHKYNVI